MQPFQIFVSNREEESFVFELMMQLYSKKKTARTMPSSLLNLWVVLKVDGHAVSRDRLKNYPELKFVVGEAKNDFPFKEGEIVLVRNGITDIWRERMFLEVGELDSRRPYQCVQPISEADYHRGERTELHTRNWAQIAKINPKDAEISPKNPEPEAEKPTVTPSKFSMGQKIHCWDRDGEFKVSRIFFAYSNDSYSFLTTDLVGLQNFKDGLPATIIPYRFVEIEPEPEPEPEELTHADIAKLLNRSPESFRIKP